MQRSFHYLFILLLALFLLPLPNPVEATAEIGGKAYYDLGVFALEDGDYEGAEKNFVTALNYEPDNAVYLHNLGKVYFKTDRTAEAETAFKKAAALDPIMPEINYDLAYLYYKSEDYQKAADLFTQVARDDPDNVLAFYFSGICLLKLNRYADAVNYFNAAADKSPTVKDNGTYYAGDCYFKMEELESAQAKFQYVRDQGQSDALKKNSEQYLKAIEVKKKTMKPYRLYAKIGYMHDGNVVLDPINDDLPKNEEDGGISAYLAGTFDFFRQNKFKAGAGYSHYQTRYNNLSEYDLTGSTVNLYAKYNLFPLVVGFSVLPAHYWLDNDDYMEQYQFRPEAKYAVSDTISICASYSYIIVNHIQYDDKDGRTHEGETSFDYVLPKELGHLYARLGMQTFSADHPDEDYTRMKAAGGVSLLDPSSGVYLNLLAEYSNKDYENTDSFYGARRSDDKYYFSVSLSRKIFYDWLHISAEYNYTKNLSNISDFEYKKNAGNISLAVNL